MALARQKPSGKWEIGLRHPSLPGGRKYFTFDTEAEANAYAEQWRLMKMAQINPPAEMLKPKALTDATVAHVVRAWANSGHAAPTQHSALGSLVMEVGAVRLEDVTYAWLNTYLQRLKVEMNLSPGSIRHRIQALGRSIDEYLRNHPEVVMQNPTRLLPKGYSGYNDRDKALVLAAGKQPKADVARDRRLLPGEEEKIVFVLSGGQMPGKPRGLQLLGGNALLTMFLVIVNTGLRLKEAYTLRRGQVDLDTKVIRVQSSKQWRGKVVFREVPMRPEVHTALVKYLSTRTMLPSAWLFPFMDEEPGIKITKVSQRLSFRYKLAFEYAGIQGLREHDLRHEATCRWLEMRDATGNWMFRLEEVNRIMGWSANSTMAQRYASFRGVDLAARMWATPAGEAARGASA
jgi:integrase